MILYKLDKQRRFAYVLVDIYDAEALINGQIDDVTKELMEHIKKKLESGIRPAQIGDKHG